MKLIAKNYKDIEENQNNEFADDILYVNNVSLIGFGATKLKNDKYYGHIFIDIAVRLDDLKSIFKIVFMYGANEQEFDNFIDTAIKMPDRGITGYCPILVIASNIFVKDKDEYYLYGVNGRGSDNIIYSLSFDTVGMIKIQYIQNLVMNCVNFGSSITYNKTDFYEPLHIDNTSVLNLAFTNQFNILGFVVPPKKLFETKFSCLCLAKFNYNRDVYYIYFNVIINSKNRKNLTYTQYKSNKELLDLIDKKNSYMMHENINIEYYSKGATDITKKVTTFAIRRDNLESIVFIFPQVNYEVLYQDAVDAILK